MSIVQAAPPITVEPRNKPGMLLSNFQRLVPRHPNARKDNQPSVSRLEARHIIFVIISSTIASPEQLWSYNVVMTCMGR